MTETKPEGSATPAQQRMVLVTALLIAVAGFIPFFFMASMEEAAQADPFDDMQAAWRANGPANYEVIVRHIDRPRFEAEHTVAVRDGAIVDYRLRCISGQRDGYCHRDAFQPADYTVDGLFRVARSLHDSAQGRLRFEIDFHPELHYPQRFRQYFVDESASGAEYEVIALYSIR